MKDIPKNVKVMGPVSEKELRELYARCKAFIITSRDEPFGMAPVEAMASGKPVVAVKEGGCLETAVDGITGLLVKPDIFELQNAINIISREPFKYKENCFEQARKFDVNIFIDKIKKEIEDPNENCNIP